MSTDLGLRTRRVRVRVRYRASDGAVVDTTLERLTADEVVGGLPVREFRWRKGQRHYSGWYWSSTVERLVAYESRLELARIMLADFDPDMVAIAAQPFQLIGADGARIRRHVPDLLLVDAAGGVTVVDVKAPETAEGRPMSKQVGPSDVPLGFEDVPAAVLTAADERELDRIAVDYERALAAGDVVRFEGTKELDAYLESLGSADPATPATD